MSIEFSDRYKALGIPYPDPNTMCLGHCEGVGFYPEHDKSKQEWINAHFLICSIFGRIRNFFKGIFKRDKIYLRMAFEKCDGWHFIKCPNCNGTGKRK